MAHVYYTHKDNPELARIVDSVTNKVVATVGTHPKKFVENDWVEQEDVTFAKSQENVFKELLEFRKSDSKNEVKSLAKRRYDAVRKAGNSEEVARQVSGYVGK